MHPVSLSPCLCLSPFVVCGGLIFDVYSSLYHVAAPRGFFPVWTIADHKTLEFDLDAINEIEWGLGCV